MAKNSFSLNIRKDGMAIYWDKKDYGKRGFGEKVQVNFPGGIMGNNFSFWYIYMEKGFIFSS